MQGLYYLRKSTNGQLSFRIMTELKLQPQLLICGLRIGVIWTGNDNGLFNIDHKAM